MGQRPLVLRGRRGIGRQPALASETPLSGPVAPSGLSLEEGGSWRAGRSCLPRLPQEKLADRARRQQQDGRAEINLSWCGMRGDKYPLP